MYYLLTKTFVIKSPIFFSFGKWMGGFHAMLWENFSSQFLLGCFLPWCAISMCIGFLGQDAGVVENGVMVSVTFYVYLNLLLWFSKLYVVVVFILTLLLLDWLICTAYMLSYSQGMLYIPGDCVPRVAWCDWAGWRFLWVRSQSSWCYAEIASCWRCWKCSGWKAGRWLCCGLIIAQVGFKCALNLISVASVDQMQHRIGSKKSFGHIEQIICLRFTSSSRGICSVIWDERVGVGDYILFHVRHITLVWVGVLAGSFLSLPAGYPLSWRSDVVQVTFYIVLSIWDFGFFDVYYSLLLSTSLRERQVVGLQGRISGLVNRRSVE